jgi:ribonuclease VapC
VIVVDTSALVAIVEQEQSGEACKKVMLDAEQIALSAGTFAEAMIVTGARGLEQELLLLLGEHEAEIVPVDEFTGDRMLEAYRRWGKGFHKARLNFGDCFAYVLAQERGWPLLFIGLDFAQTDVTAA